MQFLLPLTTLLLTLSTGVAARPSVISNLVAKDVNKSCYGRAVSCEVIAGIDPCCAPLQCKNSTCV